VVGLGSLETVLAFTFNGAILGNGVRGGETVSKLEKMPRIVIPPSELARWGAKWSSNKKGAFNRKDSMQFGKIFDRAVATALAKMLGGLPIEEPGRESLTPAQPNCVEEGACRVIGGIRPQNYDVCYRPDGPRFVFDSKSLNDIKSLQKNYQNMINDLGTEATTVHTRFPYAIVAFMVIVPEPCLRAPQREALTGVLNRLSGRSSPLNSLHKAEAIALVVWDPGSGRVLPTWPKQGSRLRLEQFSEQVQRAYFDRYWGLPPHD